MFSQYAKIGGLSCVIVHVAFLSPLVTVITPFFSVVPVFSGTVTVIIEVPLFPVVCDKLIQLGVDAVQGFVD